MREGAGSASIRAYVGVCALQDAGTAQRIGAGAAGAIAQVQIGTYRVGPTGLSNGSRRTEPQVLIRGRETAAAQRIGAIAAAQVEIIGYGIGP